MPKFRSRLPFAALLAAAAVLTGAAPAAQAATPDVLPNDIAALPRAGALATGTATLTLSSSAKGRLKQAGASLTASGSASVKGSAVRLQAAKAGSVFDPTTMQGTVVAEAGFSIKGPKGTAKLTKLTFNPGSTNRSVVATLGKQQLTLGSLKGGSVGFSGQADGVLTGAAFALSSSAAKKLSAKTGGGLAKGAFAKVTIKATAKELPLANGTATMTLDPAFINLITSNGADLVAAAPAVRTGNEVALALTGGAFDPFGKTGRLALEGSVSVVKGETSVALYGWSAAIYAGQSDLFAKINTAVAAVLANVNVSGLTSQITGKNFAASGATLLLSELASDILHQEFGMTLAAGTPMGTVRIAGQLSGS